MTSNIEKRLAALEAQLGEREKMTTILFKNFGGCLPAGADLTAPVTADATAWVSRFYSVKFWGGTPARWSEELDRLRADPELQWPSWENDGDQGTAGAKGAATPEPLGDGMVPNA